MRPLRLLLPLTIALFLATAGPAMAVDWPVNVIDYEFGGNPSKVAVGDTVVWSFAQGSHSTTSSGQAESWDSDIRSAGAAPFSHTFTKPGRYQYLCTPHSSFMKGTITVGEDEVAKTVERVRTVRGEGRVTVRFTLEEAAKVTYKLRGRSDRTYTRRRLADGRRSIKLRNLKPGSYRGTLTLVDDFDKKQTIKKRFRVP